MSTTRGKGYVKDAPHKKTQKDFGAFAIAKGFDAAALPPSASLRAYEPWRMDQGQTSSCTGHGTAAGIYTSCGAAGVAIGFVPSPRGIYANARCVELTSADAPLTDSGSMPADVMSTIATLGVRAIQAPTSDGRYSDVEAGNVNTKPTLGEEESEGLAMIAGEYRIDTSLPGYADLVCGALAGSAGTPPATVGIGVFVDSAFENWTPANGPLTAPPNFDDPNGGGHWIFIVGYTTLPTGKRVFDVCNSWGMKWGDGTGHIQIHEDWIAVSCSDCYVLTAKLSSDATEGKAA
jgi:hypothetical protein